MFISAHCLRNSRPWFQVLVLWAGGSTVLHGKRSAHLIVGRKQRQKGPGFLTAPVTAPVGACTLWPNFLLLGTSSYRFFQLFPVVAQARNQAEGLLKAPSPKLQRVTHMCLSWLLPQPSQKPTSTKLCVMLHNCVAETAFSRKASFLIVHLSFSTSSFHVSFYNAHHVVPLHKLPFLWYHGCVFTTFLLLYHFFLPYVPWLTLSSS